MKLLIGIVLIVLGFLWGLFWWLQASVALSVTGRKFPPFSDLAPGLPGLIAILIGIVILVVAK